VQSTLFDRVPGVSRKLFKQKQNGGYQQCDNNEQNKFYSAGYGKCLQDDASKDYLEIENLTSEKYFPGENYTENKQCELIYGSGTKICSYMVGYCKLFFFFSKNMLTAPPRENSELRHCIN